LDEEILAATDDDYTGVRVLDRNNVEVPFLVRCRRRLESRALELDVPMTTIDFRSLPDNRIEVLLEKKDHNKQRDRKPGVVVFSTKQKDYEKQVTVHGSPDRTNWTLLAEGTPIFDYSRHIDVRNDRVGIEPGSYIYYRVDIANISESHRSPFVQIVRETRGAGEFSKLERSAFRREDFRIEAIRFLEKKAAAKRTGKVTRQYAARNVNIVNDDEEKETVVTFEVARAPLTSLTMSTRTPNFSRPVTVEGSDAAEGKGGWRRVASSTISRIDVPGFRRERVVVKLAPARRFRRYRVTIRNLDSPPLDVFGVDAEGEIHEALFFCDPSNGYWVLYGAEDGVGPRYDIAAVLAQAEESCPDDYSLGPQEANPQYRSSALWGSVPGRWLLVGAVLLMVAVLVRVIARAAKDVAAKE